MNAEIYQFGQFTIDRNQRRLLKEGQPIDINARYLDALLLLVARPGQLVSKDEFHRNVWNGMAVTDEALTQCIRTIRRALRDDAGAPRFIETVPRHGYRFVGTLKPQQQPEVRFEGRYKAMIVEGGVAAGGGAFAGIFGACAYVALGLVAPGLGAASTMLALISLCLAIGLLGGFSIGIGIALARRVGWRSVVGGCLGGVLIGAFATIVGHDLFALLFGKAPSSFTGAPEGGLLGLALGLSWWLANITPAEQLLRRLAPSALIGGAAGGLIALAKGQLLAGSLALLFRSFPESPLRFADLSPLAMTATTALEGALFCVCCTAALLIAQRLRPDQKMLISPS